MLPFLSLRPKRFGCSVDQHVDRILLSSRPPRASIEEAVLAQMAEVKASEIYREEVFFEPVQEPEPTMLRLRSGEDMSFEERANEILVTSRRLEGKDADRREWLTTEQILLRQHKEVYNQNGFPDSSLVSGIYKRVYNPNAGSRPGRFNKGDDG